MTREVEVETRYRLMVGNLFVKSISRKGVELTTRAEENICFVDDLKYSGKDNDYYSHERQIADSIVELKEHGITDARIVEYKVVTERLEQEVKLNLTTLGLLRLIPIDSPVEPPVEELLSKDGGIDA